MPNHLPTPTTLRDAVETVIVQNTEIGYTPTRFIMAVRRVEDTGLVKVCTELICNPATLEALEKALDSYPNLLTLEDLLVGSTYGQDWEFGQDALDQAIARTQWFDKRVGYQRWSLAH